MDLDIIPRVEINADHLLQLTHALGPLPSTLRGFWPRYDAYFDSTGKQQRFSVESNSNSPATTPEHGIEDFIDERNFDLDPVGGLPLEARFARIAEIDDEEASTICQLLRMILVYEANERPSANQILGHPWFRLSRVETE